jgi:hypothetical protein
VTASGHPRVVAGAVAGALATTSLLNVAQLPRMETNEETSYRAFLRSESADMARLGLEASPTTRRVRGLYLTLALTAPGVEVISGPDVGLDAWQLHGLGRATSVVEADYDPERFAADLDVTDWVVAGDEGRLGPVPFTIALADEQAETLVVRVVGDRRDLIDLRLLPAEVAAALGR